jgi:hypothetical protein
MSGLLWVPAVAFVLTGCDPSIVTPSNDPKNTLTQGTLTQAPSGVGIAFVTEFTFTAKGFSDPNGGPLNYRWNFGDGTGSLGDSQSPSAKHTYGKTGTFDIWATVTSNVGALMPGSLIGLRVISMTGSWGIRDATGQLLMENTSITQSEQALSGEDVRANCRYAVTGSAIDPRRVTLTYTRPAGDCAGLGLPVSFTFAGEADDQVKAFTGTMTPGGPARMVKCSQPGVCE